MTETAWFHLTKEEALPVLSAVGTFLVILLVGYVLSYVNNNDKMHQVKTFWVFFSVFIK